MNIILLDAGEIDSEATVYLSDHRHHHITRVLRAQIGDQLHVGQIHGATGSGQVIRITPDQTTLTVSLDRAPPPKLPLTLVLALPRPKMLKRCLRMVAELGIAELHLINSFRVEKSYWQSPLVSYASSGTPVQGGALCDYFRAGLEQAMDTVPPTVVLHRGFRQFARDSLPQMLRRGRGLVAHPALRFTQPDATHRDGSTFSTISYLHLFVGPEGGFVDYEIDIFVAAGCRQIDLGSRIYRVETAIPLLVGRLYH